MLLAGIHLHRSNNVKHAEKKEEASTGEGRKEIRVKGAVKSGRALFRVSGEVLSLPALDGHVQCVTLNNLAWVSEIRGLRPPNETEPRAFLNGKDA